MNILVVRNDKIGDFIVSLPMIYLVKQNFPQAKVIVCVSALNASWAKELEFIDEVITDMPDNIFALSKAFRNEKIDLVFTLFSDFHIGLALFLAGIKTRIAPATKIAQIFYNKRIKQRRSEVKMSEFEYNIDLLRAYKQDINTSFPAPFFQFTELEKMKIYKAFCESMQLDCSKKIIAFHPGFGGSSNANISLDEYLEFALLVKRYKEYEVVFTFGPGEESLRAEVEAKQPTFKCYNSAGTPYDFSRLLSNFFMFVSTSTGTYHLAAATNIYTYTFFGSDLFSSAARWKSISDISKQIHKMLPYDNTRDAFVKECKQEFLSFLKEHI